MRQGRWTALRRLFYATLLYGLLSYSLGLYYTITYYGKTGVPILTVEGAGGLVFYYFSVLNVATPLQAAHWMLTFPLAGILWAGLLHVSAPPMGVQRGCWTKTLFLFSWATLPLSLPAPYLTYVVGATSEGWSLQRLILVALRRGGVNSWGWLDPLFLFLGLAALACHIVAYRRQFQAGRFKLWLHFLVSGCLFMTLLAALAALLALPARYFLEGVHPVYA